jgi:rSAM/selenodomain-associated transferase 1
MRAIHRVLDPAKGKTVPGGLCALAVMTKAPQAGRVKTRLTPPLTPHESAALNTCFLRDTAAALAETAAATNAFPIAVYTPLGAEEAYADILPKEFALVPQRGEAFGERLAAATEDLLQLGFDSLCLIDSDSPTVPAHAFKTAVERLSQRQDAVVLGPSDDGGYYLIGLKKFYPRLFERIEWSTEKVLGQTIAAAGEIDLPVHLLTTWYDVDDRLTLARLCRDFFELNASHSDGFQAPATREFLSALIGREGRGRVWPARNASHLPADATALQAGSDAGGPNVSAA